VAWRNKFRHKTQTRKGDDVVNPGRVKLLFGPYTAPSLKRGDRAFCLVRDYPVVVVGWSGARISWPRCRPLDPPCCGTGLLIDDELGRAIRHESSTAIAYWWGPHISTVHNWRKALGVTRRNNEGTYRLVLGSITQALTARFGDGRSGHRGSSPFPARGRTAVWTPDEMALLGAFSDAEVAQRTGRSQPAVLKKREQLGRPARTAQGVAYKGRFWNANEEKMVRTLPPQEAAKVTGRSLRAVLTRKKYLETRDAENRRARSR
jgi:hypothetical protein